MAAYDQNNFNSIGNGATRFTGVFDGNNLIISNFTYTSTGPSSIGLFGYIGWDSEIQNLGLIDANVDAGTGDYAGTLAGYNSGGTIENCYATGLVSGHDCIGGLVGGNGGTIENCYATGIVLGYDHAGGLCGLNSQYGGVISNCYATGSISGEDYLGGLVGYNLSNIENCYATGSVSGTERIGGIVGYNYGIIENCYATGEVDGDANVGGLVGLNSHYFGEGYVINSYWDIDTSGQDFSSGGGEGKTTAEMKMASTFINWGTCESVWTINEGIDYPRLIWEEKPGELIFFFPLQGTGEPNNPYLIYTAEDMNIMGLFPCRWDHHFILANDINMSAYTGSMYNIIGNYKTPFAGSFDGNGRRIFNFTHTSGNTNYIGLFGYVGIGGEVKNLGLENASIDITTGGSHVGTLAGLNRGKISNCYSIGSITGGVNNVGGLCGYNYRGTISKCYFEGNVESEPFGRNVGGLVGENGIAYIIMSFADANTTGTQDVGGLTGNHWGHVAIADCYSTGSVNGETNIGGLIGRSSVLDGDAGINNCYSTCYVQDNNNAGGLIGYVTNDDICHNSFWDINTSGLTVSDGGEGKTTLEMQDPNTFINAGWDFNQPIWMICGQDYPKLIWNHPDIDGSGRVDLADFAEIAARWMSFDCGMCDRVDLTGDRDIDMDDMQVLTNNWLYVDEISDHVFEVEIIVGWGYEDPNDSNDTEYRFELGMFTDSKVEKIEFMAPSGGTFEIPQMQWQEMEIPGGFIETEWEYDYVTGTYSWMYYTAFNEPNGLSEFGDGEYIITAYYDSGHQDQTTVWFGIPDGNDFIPQPTQEPVPVFPVPDSNVTSPVTFIWQPCTDPNVINIWVYAENEATDEEIEPNEPLLKETTSWGPIDLSEGLWEFGLVFVNLYQTQNNDGIDVFVAKYSEIDYEYTVVP